MNKLNATFLRQLGELGKADCAINWVDLETTAQLAVKKREQGRKREKSRPDCDIRDQRFRSGNIVRDGRSHIVQMQRVISLL